MVVIQKVTVVLYGEGAAQPAVVAPRTIGLVKTRLEDFDLVRLQAPHYDLV